MIKKPMRYALFSCFLFACATIRLFSGSSSPNDTPSQTPFTDTPPEPTTFRPAMEGTRMAIPVEAINAENARRIMELARWHLVGNPTASLFFPPQATSLFSVEQCEVNERDMRSGLSIRVFSEERRCLEEAAISPDGRRLAAASLNNFLGMWDSTSGEILFRIRDGWYQSPVFSPDGAFLAVIDARTNNIMLWDSHNGELLTEIREGSLEGEEPLIFTKLAVSPDGKTVAVGSTDGRLALWDVFTGEKILEQQLDLGSCEKLLYVSNGLFLVSSWGGKYGSRLIRVWDTRKRQRVREFSGSEFALSPDGKTIALTAYNDPITLWNFDSGLYVAELWKKTEDSVYHAGYYVWDMVFSPDGKLLAYITDDKTIHIWGIPPLPS
jgi:WD40 repeat protein